MVGHLHPQLCDGAAWKPSLSFLISAQCVTSRVLLSACYEAGERGRHEGKGRVTPIFPMSTAMCPCGAADLQMFLGS